MTIRLFAVAAIGGVLLACVTTCSANRQTRISADICKLESELDQAMVARDIAFLTTLLADEYMHTNFIGGTTDKKAELEFFASPDLVLKRASIDSCNVRVYRNVAVATGVNNWAEASYRSGDISGLYRFTAVYLLRNKRWQIVASHASKIMNR